MRRVLSNALVSVGDFVLFQGNRLLRRQSWLMTKGTKAGIAAALLLLSKTCYRVGDKLAGP